MTVREYIPFIEKNKEFCFLYFKPNDVHVQVKTYAKVSKIEEEFLSKEVMDVNDTDECKEIWVR